MKPTFSIAPCHLLQSPPRRVQVRPGGGAAVGGAGDAALLPVPAHHARQPHRDELYMIMGLPGKLILGKRKGLREVLFS